MADEVFRYQDDAQDELVVLFYPGDETIVVNFSSYGESSRIPIPREEGIKLARAILAALDASAGVELTPEQLDALPAGSEVYDVDGDMWTKQQDQRWQWGHYSPRTSHSLVGTYGPITLKGGVGSSRHADKTETGDTP